LNRGLAPLNIRLSSFLRAKKAAHVHILKGPELEQPEKSDHYQVISDNPGGSPEHLELCTTARIQEPEPNREIAIRLNPTLLYGFPRFASKASSRRPLLLHGDSMDPRGPTDGVNSR